MFTARNATLFMGLLAIVAGGAASPARAQTAADALARVTGRTIEVPGEVATIQGAINIAEEGDLVLVAPGTYNETLTLNGPSITLASRFIESGDAAAVEETILDGTDPNGDEGRMDRIILVGADAGPNTQIAGFTIQNGDDGISCEADIHILHNRFIQNVDAIDYEGGGGVCAYNVFERNEDDAIDLDGACGGVFEHNVIRDNEDDGIEIRLHPYDGPAKRAVIRHNRIVGNGEDGIQFIDYPDPDNRTFRIERNLIANNAMSGIACMGLTNTRENYEGADVDERIEVVNNTIAGNRYGITGGNTLIAVNNIIVGHAMSALRYVDYNSVVSYVLLWDNGRDNEASNLTGVGLVLADPKLDDAYRPTPGSPVIDAGTQSLTREDGASVSLETGPYAGIAPDLGVFEHGTAMELVE